MLESKYNTVNNDIRTLIKDAQALFQSAAALTGEKAEEVRQRGIGLVDTAVAKSQDLKTSAFAASKEAVAATDEYVKQNPWSSIAAGAGVGILIGLLIGRNK